VEAKDVLYENADLLKKAFPKHYQMIAIGIRTFDFNAALVELRAARASA